MNNRNFKNMNEGIQDLLGDIETSMPASILSSSKKKKRSILDEIPDIEQELNNQPPVTSENSFLTVDSVVQEETGIILPKPIGDEINDTFVNQIVQKNTINEIAKIQKIRAKRKNKVVEAVPVQQRQEIIQEVKESFETLRGEELPENVDYATLEEELDTALSEIPGGESISMIDIDIKVSETKKDKSGYFKTKVSLNPSKIPADINSISSYVKSKTKGEIIPRICDFRVIGNTNKTQLRGKDIKLSDVTIVFKPKPGSSLKVNKGTRFMISIPVNYKSTGNLIIYIQESRAKHIMELQAKDFASPEVFNEFVGDRIAEYFYIGYEVALKKLQLHKVNNPLMQLIDIVVGSGEYKAKPYIDSDDHLYSVDFVSKDVKNQWLVVNIIDSDVKGAYKILAHNTADPTWEYQISKADVTLGQLKKSFYDVLGTCYDRDWSADLNLSSDDDRFYYLYDKLKHRALKQALITINDYSKENTEFGVEIKETLSRKDTSKKLDQYNAEAIIGKTNSLNYFVLTFLAYQIKKGDKRFSADYISTPEYYQKYHVNDKRQYKERQHTAYKNDMAEQMNPEVRNYHARPYIFQLEYYSTELNKLHTFRSESFDDILNTGFLTDNIKYPTTKY